MQQLSVTTSNASSGEVDSDWIMCDGWIPGLLSVQVDVYPTDLMDNVSYSVYMTLDDPNDPMSPVDVANMTWIPIADTNLVTTNTSAQGYSAFTPRYIKVTQLSGTGGLKMTICQAGSVTQ